MISAPADPRFDGIALRLPRRMIAELADDRSAAAAAQREDFYDLHDALWKLGVRLALPDGLPPRA